MKKVTLQVNVYNILARAVEEGVAYGLRRANKYADAPQSDDEQAAFAEHLEREVLNALSEVINFGDEDS